MKVIISKEENVQTLYEEEEIPEGDGNVFNKFMNIMKSADDEDEDKIAEIDDDNNNDDNKDSEGPPPPPDNSDDGPPPPPDFD